MKIQFLLVSLILLTLTGKASAQEANENSNSDPSAEAGFFGINSDGQHFENQISNIFARRGVCQILWVSCYLADAETSDLQYFAYPAEKELQQIKEQGIRNLILILESDSLSQDKDSRNMLMTLRKELSENY
jgi:hypothetical protein